MDYLDGKLSSGETSMVLKFLQNNPDLAEELEEISLEIPQLGVQAHSFHTSLKKEIVAVGKISESNFEENFVAFHEGDLNTDEQKTVSDFLFQNPFLVADFNYLGKINIAQSGERFPNKEKLKKKPVIIPMFRYAVAASVLLLLGLGVLRYTSTGLVEPTQALRMDLPFPAIVSPLSMNDFNLQEHISDAEIQKSIIQESPIPISRQEERMVAMAENASKSLLPTKFDVSLSKPNELKQILSDTEGDDVLSLAQLVGLVIEDGIGQNDVSKGLRDEQKITGVDVVDLAAATFKNAEQPLLATITDKASGKKRVKFNLGIFEADFAMK